MTDKEEKQHAEANGIRDQAKDMERLQEEIDEIFDEAEDGN